MAAPTEQARPVRREIVAQMAQHRLAQSPYRSIQRLSCRFDGRTLTLHGHLPSFYQNQLAQEAVSGLEGVAEVVNLVQVAYQPDGRLRAADALV